MYICYFLSWVTVPMLFFPPNFAVPMREWLGECSFLSSLFLIAVLDDVLRLMLGFHIFQRLWSWSFMYEFHHFTIWSTDESLFDISFNAYSLNVCATYMCSMFSATVPMLLFHLFFCNEICAISLYPGVLNYTYVYVDLIFWLVYMRSSRVCYLWLVSWLANLLLFARKASFCLLYGLVVMYSALPIPMMIFSLYLTSMKK